MLDLDAMGHLVHGTQEGRHFSAYYDGYCYLPLYVFCDAAGTVPALAKIVAAIRQRSPQARIIVRADAGFCREAQPEVYYCVGLPKTSVLLKRLAPALADARARRCLTGAATARVFTEFEYQTGESWSRTWARAEPSSGA